MLIEAKLLPVRELTIETPEWTLEPLRIVFWADLHLPRTESALEVSAQPDPSMKIAEEAVNYLYVQIHGGADGSRRSASILG